jgi:hypothetical protein
LRVASAAVAGVTTTHEGVFGVRAFQPSAARVYQGLSQPPGRRVFQPAALPAFRNECDGRRLGTLERRRPRARGRAQSRAGWRAVRECNLARTS